MTRTEFYNGWQITIFDYGDLDNPTRIMMAFGHGGKQIDFSGYVIDDDKAIEGAKQAIDRLDEITKSSNDLFNNNEYKPCGWKEKPNNDIGDFPDVIGD